MVLKTIIIGYRATHDCQYLRRHGEVLDYAGRLKSHKEPTKKELNKHKHTRDKHRIYKEKEREKTKKEGVSHSMSVFETIHVRKN